MCLLKHRSLKLRMIYRCFRLDYRWTSQLFPVLVRSYIVFRSSLGAHGGFECVLSKVAHLYLNSLVIPSTKLASDIMKVFVKTGPGQDSCSHSHSIEVKLIESGMRPDPPPRHTIKRNNSLFPSPSLYSLGLTSHQRRPRQPRRPRLALPSCNSEQRQSSTTHNSNARHPLPATE